MAFLLWGALALVAILAAWYVAFYFSLRRSFREVGRPLELRISRALTTLTLEIYLRPGVEKLDISGTWVNRAAAEELGLGAPDGFEVALFEPLDAPEMTAAERADSRRLAEEQNRESLLFRGQHTVTPKSGGRIVFPIHGKGSLPVEISVTYTRRVGVVGESSAHSVRWIPGPPL